MLRFVSLRLISLIVFLIISFTLQLPIAQMAGVVGTCNEARLDTALGGGGTVTFACSGTIVLTTSKSITVDTIVDGSGQNVVIDGSGGLNVRIFVISPGVNFTLNNITLTRGDGSVGSGGGIYSDGNVTVTNVNFISNEAHASRTGGGISNTGTMTISNSNFVGNVSTTGGAAISNSGALTITNTTFSNNDAVGGFGGAIFNGGTGVVNISSTSFSGNNAGHGGAIYNSNGGVMNFTNVTFSDNTSTDGAHVNNSIGTLTFTNSGFFNGSCIGVLTDGGNNGKSNAPGCPGQEGVLPAPDQCQEMLDPTFAAPVGWYCQVLMRDNAWVGYAGTIPSELTDAGVIIAVDVTYYDFAGHAAQQVDGTHQVCLQGDGRFIFLSSAQSPRQIVEMESVSEGGYTCAWVSTSGTAVLING